MCSRSHFAGLTEKDELARVAAAVLRHLHNLKAKDIVSILGSLSKARYRNFQLFSALVERLEKLTPLPLNEARSVLSFCCRIHFTNTLLVKRCAEVISANLDTLRPSDVCDVLHSLTKLRHCDATLVNSLVSKGIETLGTLDDLALVNFATGCAKATVKAETVAVVCQELQSRAGVIGPLEALRSLLVLARFQSHPNAKPAATSIVKRLNCSRLSLLQLTLALEAVLSLGCEGVERVQEALETKRDAYPRVPPEVSYS
ncbi:uncharacterized protein BXIN_1834 [Babesia sp. Xinjiang]|uniref:uncharacterized protein n=1 Tax=Babesia sp. Xinjiang TaxID=462227 RepID=UPI000A219208|nr:uncharacterized protein BXIN_1834 [Babesia sp. Xinjiang]ORM40280.1 hypothetical protein BXIN_1834 [Babesia sp. Xinjiang]